MITKEGLPTLDCKKDNKEECVGRAVEGEKITKKREKKSKGE